LLAMAMILLNRTLTPLGGQAFQEVKPQHKSPGGTLIFLRQIPDDLNINPPGRWLAGSGITRDAAPFDVDIEDQLRKQIKDTTFLTSERITVKFTSASYSTEAKRKPVIVDTMIFPEGASSTRTLASLLILAAKLSKLGSEKSGLLNCKGVIQHEDNEDGRVSKVELIYSIPTKVQVAGLRDLLINESPPALDHRLEVAKQLARSVIYLHGAKFVHKNIRPETILVTMKANKKIGHPYLIGFEQLRAMNDRSLLRGDNYWYKNLYRHPERQGLYPQDEYNMRHDIYSLGVCLLEIGLWESFIEWLEFDQLAKVGRGLCDGTKSIRTNPVCFCIPDLIHALNNLPHLDSNKFKRPDNSLLNNSKERAEAMKEVYLALADEVLPAKMGTKYSDIVSACLTCLDGEDRQEDWENADEEEDAVDIGIRYLESVCEHLESKGEISDCTCRYYSHWKI
jgi:serine/threonine protein kinase